MAANKCFAEVTFAKATSCHLFLPCLLILSRSLAERRPQHPPALLHADPKLANAPICLFPPPFQDIPVPFRARVPIMWSPRSRSRRLPSYELRPSLSSLKPDFSYHEI